MFAFSAPRPSRRPSLTPMIDVVFLLLVFFMLAARFGQDVSLSLAAQGSVAVYEGPPRLVTVAGDQLALNGRPMTQDALLAGLAGLSESPDDPVFLQPAGDTSLQQMVDVLDALRAAGFASVVVVPAP